MKIIITEHFKEKLEERYNDNSGDTLEKIVARFQEIQNDIRKKKYFYSIREDHQPNWDIVYKLYDMDVCYVYSKKWTCFFLITFWSRVSHMTSIFKEMLKSPNMDISQIQEKLETQKKCIPQFAEKSVFKKNIKNKKTKLKAQKIKRAKY